MKKVPIELVDFINTGSNFIIAGHKEPDGDCIGSQLALCSALRRFGKEALVCSPGPFKSSEIKKHEDQFIFDPDKIDKIAAENTGTKAILVDCSTMERLGYLQKIIEKYPYAVIDHHSAVSHPQSTPETPIYIDSSASSCTILIEKIINTLGLEITKEETDMLLFGLCTDTGFFRHLTDKNADAFEAAAKMVRYGANPKEIYTLINGGKSLNSRILTGHILSRTESFFDGKLLLSYETLQDHMAYGLEDRDSDVLNQLLQSVEGVEAIVIIRQETVDNCSVSLRSFDKIDVAQIAASFGGGGHKNASGFVIKNELSNIKKIMLELFSEIFS